MNLIAIISILLGHWISDFLLQNIYDKSNINKKKNNKKELFKKLIKHVFNYSIIQTFVILLLQLFNIIEPKYLLSLLFFFIVTYITHFLTDFFVINRVKKVLKKNDRNKYMNTIGFDQFIHDSELFITLILFYIV